MHVSITETSSCFIKALWFCNFMHTKLSTASILCSTEFKLPYKLCQHKNFYTRKTGYKPRNGEGTERENQRECDRKCIWEM